MKVRLLEIMRKKMDSGAETSLQLTPALNILCVNHSPNIPSQPKCLKFLYTQILIVFFFTFPQFQESAGQYKLVQ